MLDSENHPIIGQRAGSVLDQAKPVQQEINIDYKHNYIGAVPRQSPCHTDGSLPPVPPLLTLKTTDNQRKSVLCLPPAFLLFKIILATHR